MEGADQMQLKKAEREKITAQSSRFSQRIGSTVYEVNIRFDTAKQEPLEDKILRLIKRDLDYSPNHSEKANSALKTGKKGAIMDLPQADGLPERGSA
jgi:hypothetical protein